LKKENIMCDPMQELAAIDYELTVFAGDITSEWFSELLDRRDALTNGGSPDQAA
jgi:hypothetical protein